MVALHNAPATFFDGTTAARQSVTLTAIADGMAILDENGQTIEVWPFADIRRVRDTGTRQATALYLLGDAREARLTLSHIEDTVALKQVAPDLDKRPSAAGSIRKIAMWSGAAAAAVTLMIFVIIPGLANQMAAFIPPEREEALGRTTFAQIERFMGSSKDGEWVCDAPEGNAALAKMADRIRGDLDLPYELEVRVVDHGMINAFALPGGQVVFMRGLIKKADSAEEVAGVFAHELGHVAARDPMRLTLRAAGSAGILSLVLGDATGGTVIALVADQALNASHTRAAEANADAFALDRLDRAGVSPKAFAGFFDKLRAEYGDTPKSLEWFSSHPNLAGRADAARASNSAAPDQGPILTDIEWAALQSICD